MQTGMGRNFRLVLTVAAGVGVLSACVPLISQLEFERTVDRLQQVGGRVHVSTAGNIVGVSFEGASLSNQDLSRLQGLNRLQRLSVAGTAVSCRGLDELGELSHLADLDLSGTPNAAESLSHLHRFPSLDTLRLHGCAWVTDRSLAGLSTLNRLTALDLSATPITDEGLRTLAPGTHLRYLNLAQCRGVTDLGLEQLLLLPQLKAVQLQGTQVTLAAVARLQQQRPDLVVSGVEIPRRPSRRFAPRHPAVEWQRLPGPRRS
jgi:hypothetical protein